MLNLEHVYGFTTNSSLGKFKFTDLDTITGRIYVPVVQAGEGTGALLPLAREQRLRAGGDLQRGSGRF